MEVSGITTVTHTRLEFVACDVTALHYVLSTVRRTIPEGAASAVVSVDVLVPFASRTRQRITDDDIRHLDYLLDDYVTRECFPNITFLYALHECNYSMNRDLACIGALVEFTNTHADDEELMNDVQCTEHALDAITTLILHVNNGLDLYPVWPVVAKRDVVIKASEYSYIINMQHTNKHTCRCEFECVRFSDISKADNTCSRKTHMCIADVDDARMDDVILKCNTGTYHLTYDREQASYKVDKDDLEERMTALLGDARLDNWMQYFATMRDIFADIIHTFQEKPIHHRFLKY